MPYRVVIFPRVQRQIAQWPMPDDLIVDCHMRLEALRDQPARQLMRAAQPFDGMALEFSLIDPTNRFCEHRFAFHVAYGTDEETLFVVGGTHERFTMGV